MCMSIMNFSNTLFKMSVITAYNSAQRKSRIQHKIKALKFDSCIISRQRVKTHWRSC